MIERIDRSKMKPGADAYLNMQYDGKNDGLTFTNYDYISQSYNVNIESEGQQQNWEQPQGSEIK